MVGAFPGGARGYHAQQEVGGPGGERIVAVSVDGELVPGQGVFRLPGARVRVKVGVRFRVRVRVRIKG